MQKNDLLSRLLSLFSRPEPRFRPFLDGLGNFELSYPDGWRYDKDIAVVDGQYTISFSSPDGKSAFTVAVDAKLPAKLNFASYVRSECGPSSGIVGDMKRSTFHGMPSFKRDYSLICGGRRHFGGGLMMHSMGKVFSLSWSAPESDRKSMEGIFGRMKESFKVRRGFGILEA